MIVHQGFPAHTLRPSPRLLPSSLEDSTNPYPLSCSCLLIYSLSDVHAPPSCLLHPPFSEPPRQRPFGRVSQGHPRCPSAPLPGGWSLAAWDSSPGGLMLPCGTGRDSVLSQRTKRFRTEYRGPCAWHSPAAGPSLCRLQPGASQEEAPEKDALSLTGLTPSPGKTWEPEPEGWCTLFTM